MKSIKNKLNKKEIIIGSWVTLPDPSIAEIMVKAGFDWLTIDMEHSSLSMDQAQELIRIISLSKSTPLVRVMDNNPAIIKRFMDMGAHGIIAPRVNNEEDAKKVVDAVKYPPIGSRGVGLFRAQDYSLDLDNYQKWNEKESIVIVQIEDIKAINNLESILDVDGIDGFIVGPYDLSASMGFPGDFENPSVIKAFNKLEKFVSSSPKSWGHHIVNPNPDIVIDKINMGYTFIAFGVDFLFFNLGCNERLSTLKDLIIKQKK
tara:strand:- start:456 stop:1235 length:780 start_codon:yes stop_codon:yes gene_type:complete